MNVTGKTIRAILERHDSDVEWCSHYGEPGYTDPDKGIVFANWNKVPKLIGTWLEHHGYECEWSDEWTIDYDGRCYAYRTSPDSYSWKRSYVYTDDGDIIGKRDIDSGDMIDEYIAYLLDSPTRCDTMDVDWTKYGFAKLNREEYESGWHDGQTDNPATILAEMRAAYPGKEFIFTLDESSQSYIRFSVYGRDKDTDDSDDSEI